MPTIIEALVTTLTLDSASFIANAKSTREATKAMTAEQRQFAKDMDEFAAHQKQAFRDVGREALGMLAIFTAGKGIKEFVADMVTGDAALGRFSVNIKESVGNISAWEYAVQQFGGTAAGLDGTMQGLTSNLAEFALTGQSSLIPWLRTLGVDAVDASGKLKPMNNLLLDISKSVQGMDRLKANAILSHMGIDQGTANLLLQGPAAVQSELDRQKALGVPTEADVKRAQELERMTMDFKHESTDLGRTILREVEPPFIELLKYFNQILSANHGAMAHEIGSAVKSIADYIERMNWRKLADDAESFLSMANTIAQAMGGWMKSSELLFALWAGASFFKFVANFAKIAMLAKDAALAIKAVQAASAAAAAASAAGTAAVAAPAAVAAAAPAVAGAVGAGGAGAATTAAGAAATGAGIGLALGAGVAGGILLYPGQAGKGETAALNRQRAAHPEQFPMGTPAATPEARTWSNTVWGPLLNLIGKSEGTDAGRGYNETLAYGKWTGGSGRRGDHSGDVDLVNMKVSDVMNLQQSMLDKQKAAGLDADHRSSAIGRYQFTQTTLRDMQKDKRFASLFNDPNQKFDAAFQDKLAAARIQMAGSDDPETLAKIWASLPRSAGDKTGAYGQGSHVQFAEVEQARRQVHENMAHAGDRSAGGGSVHNGDQNHQEVHIGEVNVHTAATDSDSIAKSIKPALTKYSFVKQSDTGMMA